MTFLGERMVQLLREGAAGPTGAGTSIYLAGKVGRPDWRRDVVSDLFIADRDRALKEWPVLPKAVLGVVDYVGPYFSEAYKAHDFEGNPERHGVDFRARWNSSETDPAFYHNIAVLCQRAIEKADIFLAWLDSHDCYGTLVEIGYAVAIQRYQPQKRVVISSRLEFDADRRDLAFAFSLWGIRRTFADNPLEAVRYALEGAGSLLESPAEEAFWRGLREATPWLDLRQQLSVLDGRYRLDFADEETKTAIEIDGYSYHGDDRHFRSDRERDRVLAQEGWLVVRFAAKDVFERAAECAKEAATIINGRRG